MALPVAIQLYSLREEAEKDLKGTLKAVKEMGYDGVEFAGLYGHSFEEVKAILEDLGLRAISAHVPMDDMLAAPAEVFGAYKSLGCDYIAIPYAPEDRRPDAPGFPQTLQQIADLGAAAKAAGLVLLYHNHDFEFVKLGDEYGLDVLYASVPADLLQTEVDTCWVKVAGVDPAEYVRKYTGRAPVVHLKDYTMGTNAKDAELYELIGIASKGTAGADAFSFRPVGHGCQDLPALLAASTDAGAKWVVVEQDRPAKGQTAMESAALSREALKVLGW
ncbi:MAG: sugar phosphate isomerase/epimerase [Oscillospiraceae bacterium]|jgi:sugar phosphate isomerase/epimerase|nr:sugar phosphate isomerase/epimerase [Oscillospiraceae bacterium]